MGRDNGGPGGRAFKNNYKGHVDKTKGGGSKQVKWGWLGVVNADNCN